MIKKIINKVFLFFIAFLLSLFILRFVSYAYVSSTIEGAISILSPYGFCNDFAYAGRLFIFLGIILYIIHLIFNKVATFLLYVIPILLLWVELLLIEYFKTMAIMLDEGIYNYSLQEIITISGGGASMNVFIIIALLIIPATFIGLVYFLKKGGLLVFQNTPSYVPALILIAGFALPAVTDTKEDHFNQLANNRTSYFLARSYKHFKESLTQGDQKSSIFPEEDFEKLNPNFFANTPISKKHPFFHEVKDTSGLGNYLKTTTDGKAPNIVLLMCESLSTFFVGDNAYKTGHIMPFLDSLSEESLYWPNFMSVCDRTYHVLPGSLASIPVIPGGKIFQEMEYPKGFSLMNLLANDYYSRFYCGAFLSFTQMDGYMNANSTDYLVKDWEPQFSDTIDGKKAFWGYHEADLFDKSWVDYQNQALEKQKRLDIFLTVSTHPPFILKEKEKYLQKTKALIKKNAKKYNQDYTRILHRFIDEYSTYNYLDDQIKHYFEMAKQHPDYENTIFIIYGDHGTGLASIDDLSSYRIPLIVYSPLLKKAEKFLGVSSQLDLAPTIINYLKENYLPNLPDKTPFAGRELSYSTTYENDRTLLLGTFVRNADYYMDQGYFLRNQQLFKIDKNLHTHEVEDTAVFNSLNRQKEYAKNIVNYAIYNDKLAPIDYLSEYTYLFSEKAVEFYESKEVTTQEAGEYLKEITIGDVLQVDASADQLVFKLNVQYKGEDTDYESIPKLVIDITDENGNYVHWTNIYFFEEEDLVANQWNKLFGSKTIDLNEIFNGKDRTGKKLNIRFYLDNDSQQALEYKQLTLKVTRKDKLSSGK